MDPRQWFRSLPLFHALPCIYCGGPSNTSDHTPPLCLLPRPYPSDTLAMTVPACDQCNVSFSADEKRAAAIICTVSFMSADRIAVAPGGWMYQHIKEDPTLEQFLDARLGNDGIFHPDELALQILGRVANKTAVGLLFHEFGRTVPLSQIRLLAIEHTHNIEPSTFVEINRYEGAEYAEVTPSGRQLERQVVALFGSSPPPHMPKWRPYVPEFFEYMFIRRSSGTLLTAMKLHEALTVLLECPWPSKAGPRRRVRRLRNKGLAKLHE